MIDVINIFSKGGVLLWSYNFYDIGDTTMRMIVKNILIEEKYDEFCKKFNNFHVKWKLINDLDIVILIVYQGIQNTSYLDNLFLKIKKSFIKLFPNNIDVFEIDIPINFDKQFLKILDENENIFEKKSNNDNKKKEKNNKFKNEEEKLNDNDENLSNNKKKGKIKKTAREWEMSQKVTKKDLEKLDYSKNQNKNNYNEIEKYEGEIDDSSDDNNDNSNTFLTKLNDTFLKFFSYNNKIEEEDIENILQEIKNKLLSKNVAVDICDTLMDRMKENLIGKRKTIFARNIKNVVSNVLTETLQTILIPKDSVDVLRSALEAKSLGKLYSIVFLGVNGVGKSTNLAKVCYYLKNKGNLKIMIAACDTFRAGAVEQLRTHANCLDVFLYEKGYGKDASNIAKDAILYAKKENYDVILIDTAGRMQDNEPLMRSLGKLILNNNPDLILFVGEALVGNDAIDQLKKFNQALAEATCNSNKRTIDGILLTKFDTVDDKVGTALSMVYLTGKPIVFVGVGQKYTHLKKFNVNMVVKALS
ncbi:signal recognition particle receptor alpha subunit, putative [Plasmodium gallinaceum]|uniref:Signal recognition particle receptor alpha subunit, putative n=1 Tax=Plasmodium gallinaceum TaxID=5849 RepID=A0A1J1GRU2_PLAGA|nr:signal recognition particle receptor alpha subunit, putative [Plasmodium gallinaceum]CRG94024.1 signal recognition particle receptor alpha subunit, putative [Plasmodium gallinaceum]